MQIQVVVLSVWLIVKVVQLVLTMCAMIVLPIKSVLFGKVIPTIVVDDAWVSKMPTQPVLTKFADLIPMYKYTFSPCIGTFLCHEPIAMAKSINKNLT